MSPKLTENQIALLKTASLREDRCFALPSNLKGAPARKVAAKLIAEGLAKEIKAKAGTPIWRRDGESDRAYSLKMSAAAIKAIATNEEQSAKRAPAQALQDSPPDPMGSSETYHHAETGKAAPRRGSKLASVIDLLRRSEGATIEALTKATDWLPHTTRAAITGVRKRGYSVVLDRSAEGAPVYRLSDLQESEAATSDTQTVADKKPARLQREAKAKTAA